jgi:hypothetical protein
MDQSKRDRLVAALSSNPQVQVVAIETFFDGNDDVGSIGCNLMPHPGIEVFRSTLERIAKRPDVEAVYARISEVDPGEDSWPFADTVLIVGSIPVSELASELAALGPDEVDTAANFGIPTELAATHSSPILAAWWD